MINNAQLMNYKVLNSKIKLMTGKSINLWNLQVESKFLKRFRQKKKKKRNRGDVKEMFVGKVFVFLYSISLRIFQFKRERVTIEMKSKNLPFLRTVSIRI